MPERTQSDNAVANSGEINTVQLKEDPNLKKREEEAENQKLGDSSESALNKAFSLLPSNVQAEVEPPSKKVEPVVKQEETPPATSETDPEKLEPEISENIAEPNKELTFNSVLESLNDTERNVVNGVLQKAEERRKESEGQYYRIKNDSDQTQEKIKELESKLEEANKVTLDEDANKWFQGHSNEFEDSDLKGLESVSKSLYQIIFDQKTAFDKLESKFQSITDNVDSRIKDHEVSLLEKVERRFTDDFDDVYKKDNIDKLVDWVKSDPALLNSFVDTRNRLGVARAAYESEKNRLKTVEINLHPDRFVPIDQVNKANTEKSTLTEASSPADIGYLKPEPTTLSDVNSKSAKIPKVPSGAGGTALDKALQTLEAK